MNVSDTNYPSLYIHIPFCQRKCRYCSFVSYAGRENDMANYIHALNRELKLRLPGYKIRTLYFGGGTPSLLAIEQIESILETVNSISGTGEIEELSLEANPGMVDIDYLRALRKAGINRLSLGIQSFDDNELALLGRIHNSEQARRSIGYAREAGFDNLNLDIICGIPGQSRDSFEHTLTEAINIRPEHISLYPLTLEEDTPMWHSIQSGEIPPPDADLAADQYELAEKLLADAGFVHYEISNWARSGFACRHNLVYWLCRPYIGVGVAAHSYIDSYRMANTPDLDKYLASFSPENDNPLNALEMKEPINLDLVLSESIIMGLRLCNGININGLNSRFGINFTDCYHKPLEEMTELGLLEVEDGNLRLTAKGRLLGNEVFQRFLPV
jgi:oxygen-independent coproporphyrinogen III oxidase